MRRSVIFILTVSMLAASCAEPLTVARVEVPESYVYAPENVADTGIVNVWWWREFGDRTLDSLIMVALENNRNLLTAVSRVDEARLSLRVARSEFLPQFSLPLSAGADYSRETKIVQKYSAEVLMQWEISLFGAMKNTSLAARAAILSEEWACRGVMLSLVAQVAESYFTLLQYEECLRISQESLELRMESFALVDSMYRYGFSSGLDRDRSLSLVESAAASIPQYRRAVEQTRMSLATLLGITPLAATRIVAGRFPGAGGEPPRVPAGLPSDLLERRPDVMQAYWTWQQAVAKVGVANAARYPSISLTGSGGIASTTLKGLTSHNPSVWSVAASVMEPIFNFGSKKRAVQIAREVNRQALLAYEQSVIGAMADVETALSDVATYTEQALHAAAVSDLNVSIRTKTWELYRSGFSDYLDVIDAERSLYSSQLEYVEVLAQRYISYVNLFKALGGGFSSESVH